MPDDDLRTDSAPPNDEAPAMSPAPGADLHPGDRVGHYKILERLGEGGFAIVYAAERKEPFKQKVALKIIKLGMDTKQVRPLAPAPCFCDRLSGIALDRRFRDEPASHSAAANFSFGHLNDSFHCYRVGFQPSVDFMRDTK